MKVGKNQAAGLGKARRKKTKKGGGKTETEDVSEGKTIDNNKECEQIGGHEEFGSMGVGEAFLYRSRDGTRSEE